MSDTFAELYPLSHKAREALERQIEWLEQCPNEHLASFFGKRADTSRTEIDSSLLSTVPSLPVFTLSFRALPEQFLRIGWRIGQGSDQDESLEFALAPSEQLMVYATLKFHPRSGFLMLEVTREGYGRVRIRKNGRYESVTKICLALVHNIIRFNDLEYCLSYTIKDPESYNVNQAAVLGEDSVLRRDGWNYFPKHDHASLAPLENYILQGAIGEGTFGKVYAGIHKISGEPVAVKEIQLEQDRGRDDLIREAKISLQFTEKAFGILQTEEVMCQHSNELPCGMNSENYYIITRLAVVDFAKANWGYTGYQHRLFVFKCTLEGLSFLHRSGYIHRDITRSNLLIMTCEPIEGVIADFGKMIRARVSSERSIGPKYTLAPEVWYSLEYTNAIDVWSLAYAWLATFEGRIPIPAQIDRETHKAIYKKIDSLQQTGIICESFANILHHMLSWDASSRITASNALESAFWPDLEEVEHPDRLRNSWVLTYPITRRPKDLPG